MVQNWVVVVVVGAKTVKNSVEALIRAEIEKNSLSLSLSLDELWEESLTPSY